MAHARLVSSYGQTQNSSRLWRVDLLRQRTSVRSTIGQNPIFCWHCRMLQRNINFAGIALLLIAVLVCASARIFSGMPATCASSICETSRSRSRMRERIWIGRTGCFRALVECLTELPHGLGNELANVVGGFERSEPRHGGGIGEVPLVLGNADEIANRRVGRPDAPQRRLGQFRRHTGLQKGADVAAGRDGLDGGQACRIESRLRSLVRIRRSALAPCSAAAAVAASGSRSDRVASAFRFLTVSRFNRDQRATKVLGSLIVRSLRPPLRRADVPVSVRSR